ncbi:MAG: hypothetical protein LBJ39_03260 [Tannerellaceae bacterium]|jgi:hypothetical protein|nr:hypothetical protein [Tannerellaceae bacterium]
MKQKLFFLILLLSVAAGCSKDDDDTDKPFIGRWQEIGVGNTKYPELPPSGSVIEFFEDGTVDYYSPPRVNYHTDAEFLYLNSGKFPDGNAFRYTFVYNLLRLDHVDGVTTLTMGTPSFYIYKRLK